MTAEEAMTASGLDATCQTAVLAMSEAHDRKQWQKCVEVGDAWLEARGEMPVLCLIWYAQSLMGVMRLGEAAQWSKVAAENVPSDEPLARIAALGSYAQCLAAVGQYDTAKKIIKQLVAISCDEPEAKEKVGHMLLAISPKWRDGWVMHEQRVKTLPANCTEWDGVSRVQVAVLHEQGMGDAVLTARWLTWLDNATGHRPVYYGPSVMHRWVQDVADVGDIDADQEKPLTAVYAMSLPYFAGVRRSSDIPEPYAPETLKDHRAVRYNAGRPLKVGVCWRGASIGSHDFQRSYSVHDFASLVQPMGGVEFVNLCHDADIGFDYPFAKVKFSDVYDTGEVISSLDLVITVDTGVGHIAGSLGVPTLCLVPTVPDWRYDWPHGCRSPFYPSMVVLRKPRADDWTFCVEKARTMLAQYRDQVRRKVA